MKTFFLILGLLAATVVMLIPLSPVGKANEILSPVKLSPRYKWTQVAPPGSGTHQYDWKPGTYPSAIVPMKAFDGDLWMVGQKKVWSSKDGIKWHAFDKHDWGERISMAYVFFNNTFWILGGMEYATNTFLNEIWSSRDGVNWKRTVSNAEWSPRKGHTVVEFKNRLWLFGGETRVDEHRSPVEFVNDIWSSADGIHWESVADNAPWELRGRPQLTVFKDRLWLIGGQGHSDVWRSDDGKDWRRLKNDAPWKDRYDYGLHAFDNFLWVIGGREENPRNAYKDVWFSHDGVNWQLQTDEAPWTRRSGGFSVAFGNKLFLYGGKHTGHEDSFSGDIWTMEPIISK